MDYAFINAINYIPAIVLLLLLYDIMCQYWVNFLSRTRKAAEIPALSNILKVREDLIIKRGIGLFHVHGHIKECYSRYAPTFIDGAGMIDGEIIETLWHILNDTATSARAMSWSHRQEYLDIHMGDSNWKKLVRIGMYQVSRSLLNGLMSSRSSYPKEKMAGMLRPVFRYRRISC